MRFSLPNDDQNHNDDFCKALFTVWLITDLLHDYFKMEPPLSLRSRCTMFSRRYDNGRKTSYVSLATERVLVITQITYSIQVWGYSYSRADRSLFREMWGFWLDFFTRDWYDWKKTLNNYISSPVLSYPVCFYECNFFYYFGIEDDRGMGTVTLYFW